MSYSVGYTDKEVAIKHILINPIVKQAGLVPILEKFQQNTFLSEIITERAKLTHRLSYDAKDPYFRPSRTDEKDRNPASFRLWCNKWREEIETYAEKTYSSTKAVLSINDLLASKIVKYKDSVGRSRKANLK